MNLMALVSAILIGGIAPLAAELPECVKAAEVVLIEDEVVAAVIPECNASYEEKSRSLQEAADILSKQQGKRVLLTQDLLTYLILFRMRKRGVDAYERKNLASRLAKVKDTCYYADPPEKAVA